MKKQPLKNLRVKIGEGKVKPEENKRAYYSFKRYKVKKWPYSLNNVKTILDRLGFNTRLSEGRRLCYKRINKHRIPCRYEKATEMGKSIIRNCHNSLGSVKRCENVKNKIEKLENQKEKEKYRKKLSKTYWGAVVE